MGVVQVGVELLGDDTLEGQVEQEADGQVGSGIPLASGVCQRR